MKRTLAGLSLLVAQVAFAVAVHAAPITYYASLSGPAESPPNASPGTGFATIVYDDTADTLYIDLSFSGLIGNTTASHIHCCTALPEAGTVGVATQTPTFVGFPLGVTSGTYTHTFDLTLASSWNGAFINANGGSPASAEAALAAGLASRKAYLNIHTNTFPGGEIRGFLVPEPAMPALFAVAIASLAFARRLPRRVVVRRS